MVKTYFAQRCEFQENNPKIKREINLLTYN